ncbi:MAG: hypothetical protein KGR98_01190, partial [Verrucomicrobia bacterium]|nr:hypothetical protein [Verrucomicrobiota bacterium]
LLLSDLGSRGQDALLAARPAADLRADVVIAGLPARGEPLRDPLLDAIHPRLIVIADSPVFSERAARARLKARLRLRNVPVIYTRDSGAVTITLRPSGWSARSMDGIQLRP